LKIIDVPPPTPPPPTNGGEENVNGKEGISLIVAGKRRGRSG